MIQPLAPDPAHPVGRYRKLSPKAGVLVSPIQLGAMSLGSAWAQITGKSNKEDAYKYLDAYYQAGGNFIDTANMYQNGENEEILGECMESRGIRDQIVIATKYTGWWKRHEPGVQQAVFTGNSLKSMKLSLEASLKRLRTSYVDIFYLHWFDSTTSVEEIMDGLHAFVLQGSVLYLGVSNTQAFRVSQCNQYARYHGKSQFVVYQGEWNVLKRDVEREILPMCKAEGMAFVSWNTICTGKLRTDAEEKEREASGENGREGLFTSDTWKRNEVERKMCLTLEKIAKEIGTDSVRAVAVAYHLQKQPYVFPCLGGRKVEHLMSNLDALKVVLSDEHIKEIESVAPFDLGYPNAYLGELDPGVRSVVCYDVVLPPLAIRPKLA